MLTSEMEKNMYGTQACGCGCGCAAPETAVEKPDEPVRAPAEPRAAQTAPRIHAPAADVFEDEHEAFLILDMPGVDSGGVEITLEKNILNIKGRPAEVKFEGRQLLYAEYGMGEYQRSFVLSEDIDREAIQAAIKDGVLKVRLPKAAAVNKKIVVGNG